MATYKYSDLIAVGTTTTFDGASGTGHKPLFTTSDSFVFDVENIAASSVAITGTTSTTITIGSNIFIFTNFALGKISATNFTFADGSKLIIGDGTTSTSLDASANTLVGTEYNDYLDGMSGSDTVSYATASSAVTVNLTTNLASGGAGSDKLANIENIIGSAYNDTLTGIVSATGSVGSRLNGGLGIDALTGGAGNDTFVVTAGDTVTDASTEDSDTVESSVDYVLSANLENLTLLSGATVGVGNATKNLLKGNSGNNVLEGKGDSSATDDTLTGGDGNDTYIITDGTEVIIETNASTTQIDTVISSGTVSLLATNVENLLLIGAKSGTGNSLNNIIYASSGANATLDGGSGTDTLSYQFGATAGVTLTLNAAAADTTGSGTDASSNFEILIGSRYSDTLTGDAAANTITGGLGNDRLNGGTNAGVLIDKLDGGAGNDTYIVDTTTDTIVDSAGTDTVQASVAFSIASLAFIENVTASGTTGITVTGNSLANTLTSASSSGNDTLAGGTANDIYVISASDVVDENFNAGTDTVQVSASGYTLADNVENLTVLASAAAATASGNELANIITGNDLGNTLNGAEGNDKLVGGALADVLDGGDGNDNMTGGNGGDTYKVDSATDTLVELASGTGNDLVETTATYTLGANFENLTLLGNSAINGTGNDASNTILGNAKNNILTGGKGADIITGGAGKDSIVLTESTSLVDKVVFEATATGNGSDTITGFLSGTDTIDLDAVTGLTTVTTVTGTLTNVADSVYFLGGQAAGSADSLAAAAAAITAAATWTSAAVTTNIIVVDDNSTAIYEWVETASSNGAAAAELKLMGTIDAVTVAGDYLFA